VRPPQATAIATSVPAAETKSTGTGGSGDGNDTEDNDGKTEASLVPSTAAAAAVATPEGEELAQLVRAVLPPELAEEVGRSNVVAVGAHYYLFGGLRTQSDRAMRYDTRTGAWETLAAMPRAFMAHALAATGAGQILVIAGMSHRMLLNCHRDAYLYTPGQPSSPTGADRWETLPDLPYDVGYHSATVYRDPKDRDGGSGGGGGGGGGGSTERLVVLGGAENPETYEMYRSGVVLDFRTLKWSAFDADMVQCRMCHTVRLGTSGQRSSPTGGVLRFTGGEWRHQARTQSIKCGEGQGEEYDFATRKWLLNSKVAAAAASVVLPAA
jgi:hypothetical protein